MPEPVPPIYVVQVAKFGAGGKLGIESDPEGAWTDHDVFLDREEAERVAHALETGIYVDEQGRDISAEVVTSTRVLNLLAVEGEQGFQRMNLILTMFRSRITELLAEHRKTT